MEFALFLPVLIMSVVVHEYAHGWAALRQGDDTAQQLGRLTLNPIAHIDLVGSILFPALLWFTNAGFLFGWAKPVPVNPRNYREYVKGDIIVSMAGIVSNLILALLFTLLAALFIRLAYASPALFESMDLAQQAANYGVLINLVLAFFNLIPIPPLDGSHVLAHLLPPRVGALYQNVGRFGILILLGIMFLAPGVLFTLLTPVYVLQDISRQIVELLT